MKPNNPTPAPNDPPCENLPKLQGEINKLMQELDTLGGFRPNTMLHFAEFTLTCGEHVDDCAHCAKAVADFTDFLHAHPRPPKTKHTP